MRQVCIYSVVILLGVATPSSALDKTLRIYCMDANGGGMTLIVTPLGESILIDTGDAWPDHRYVERILHACADANVVEIDHLVTSHGHADHSGGIEELVNRLPVRRFYDNGNSGTRDAAYLEATQGKSLAMRPGDDIPLAQDTMLDRMQLHCLASNLKVEGFDGDIHAPIDGLASEGTSSGLNARGAIFLLTYGSFTYYASADLTFNVERHMVYPVNRIGHVDLYLVSHHGLGDSNNPLLLDAVQPTVALASNGPGKGITPEIFERLMAVPSLEAIYQIAYNKSYGAEGNAPFDYIANRPGQTGNWIKATVYPDAGIFEMEVSRRGVPIRAYAIKPLFVPKPDPVPGGGRQR